MKWKTYIQKFILCIILIFFCNTLMAQDKEKVHHRNPVKSMFVQRYLHLSTLPLAINFMIKNRWFKYYKKYRSSPVKKGWSLTFEDNFDSIDIKKWRLGQPWGYFHDQSLHQHHSTELIKVKDGYLYLGGGLEPKSFTYKDSTIVIPYGIGLINSDISFKQKYGYFEIRCKNPEGPATWPAFWLTGASRWPPEIDIFEMYGKSSGKTVHRQISSIHYGVSGTGSRATLIRQTLLPHNTDSVFHVYACDWSKRKIKFYTDGILTRQQRINKRLRKYMDEEMVIIINNGFEARYLKYLPENFKQNNFIVDWVRVYRKD
ncbi:MAG: glycoside hydrolase family 16 protein [Flavobacteriales bacterium]|nr:glycoside hydrolase family 16 protein [Flavobacteriales bacterium]